MSDDASGVLDYGRAPPGRWRRLIRWTVVALLLVALALAGLFAFRSLSLWLARREGYAKVTAWYQQARTSIVPAGTLLYSENPVDFRSTVAHTLHKDTNQDNTQQQYATFEQPSSLLRMIDYDSRGVPITFDADVLYVHEHLRRVAPGSSQPNLFCIVYFGRDAQGLPQFLSTTYELADPTGKLRFPFMGSTTNVQAPTTRSLANLRIFAGAPNATDPTRFSLPFTCDGGHGRFEFQTDVDVTDGGQLAPTVTIAWDDAPTSQPAARPGVADAVSR